MKKRLTDRKWIPLCLTNSWKIKCLVWLIGLVLVIFLVLWLLGIAIGQELLGRLPLEFWNQGTPEQQQQFIEKILQDYMQEHNCQKAIVMLMTNQTSVYFLAICAEVKGNEI